MRNADLIPHIHYNNWVNRRLIQAAEGTPPELLAADAQLSKGSAFETIRHMVDVEWSWHLGHSPGNLDFLDYANQEE